MLAFRKLFLALALVTLTAAVVSAQPAFQCVANAGVPPIVRAEGLAELVGDMVLNCNNGIPTAAGAIVPQVNVQIFLNTNITSKLLDSNGGSEALLMIDEPTPEEQRICVNSLISSCTVTANPAAPGLVYKPHGELKPYNVWQGRQAAPNSLVWLGVPIDAPGTLGQTPNGRIIRITNVRAWAYKDGQSVINSSTTLIPPQIVMYVSITGSTSVPINNPQQVVAFIQQGLKFSVLRYNDDGTSSALNRNQCASQNSDLAGDSSVTGQSGCPTSRLRYEEGFASSFKMRSNLGPGVGDNQNSPGAIFNNSESGFYTNGQSDWNGLDGIGQLDAGAATQGTRLRAVINGVPANVRVYVTLKNSGSVAGSITGNEGTLVAVSNNGSGNYVAMTGQTHTGSSCDLAPSTDIAEVPIFGGSGVAVWEVTGTNALAIQKMDFGLLLAWKSGKPDLGTVTVNGSFAPVSTVNTADMVAPVPRFVDTAAPLKAVNINQCVSNLLFPFVTNQQGFNTGMVIANTSKDPYGTSNESGTCTLNYYGNTNGGDPPAAQTSAAVPAGTYVAWTLLDGGTNGVLATPGFQGYVIAQCKFRWAHGYAFISDTNLQRVANGYLALVLDQGQNTRFTNVGETLGN